MQSAATMSPATCVASTSGRCSAVLLHYAHASACAHQEIISIKVHSSSRFLFWICS